MTATAILLCAGKGERLRAAVDKALVPLAGRPLFTWSLEAFERTPAIERIVVVGPVKRMKELLAASGLSPRKIVGWTEGGRERQDSVSRGLQLLPDDTTLVAIHDCARALVTPELIARVLADAAQHGGAIAALPLADTLKRGVLGVIEATVPRQGLWCAQTPQAFRREWIVAAHAAAAGKATDDAALVEALGHRVHLTTGDPLNIKITTLQDLDLAEAWLTRTSART